MKIVRKNMFDPVGPDPLMSAILADNIQSLSSLLKKGYNINNKGLFNSPLYAEVDIDGVHFSGGTPLFAAVSHGHSEIVYLLLENKASVNRVDKYGSTPLGYAVLEGNLDMVKLLLDFGADANIMDKEGETPLDYAKEEYYKNTSDDKKMNIVKCLEDHQNNLNIVKEHFDSGIWINDFKLIKFLPKHFFIQATTLVQIFDMRDQYINNKHFINSYIPNQLAINLLPLELFHELLVELWGLSL